MKVAEPRSTSNVVTGAEKKRNQELANLDGGYSTTSRNNNDSKSDLERKENEKRTAKKG